MRKKITIEDLAALIQRTMASKEDLKLLATKDDLKLLATKEELKLLATDMKEFRRETQDGLRAVNRRIDLLHEDISDLPDMREELRDLDKRMGRVERKVGITR